MKSYRQQKRKRDDVTRNQDECTAVIVKKPANGACQEPQGALEGIMMPHLDRPIQVQTPSTKMKLQLFPLNKQTRLRLEKDGCNPFLELTLSTRKRISSVVRHLNTKWGCSSTETGQLLLFPYDTKLEHASSCRRWSVNDSVITVWEVYVDVGSPSTFRLRYDWLCNHQLEMLGRPPEYSILEAHTGSRGGKASPRILETPNDLEKQINESFEAIKEQCNADETLHSDADELKSSDVPTCLGDVKATTEADPVCPTIPWDDNLTMLSIGGLLSEISLQGKINGSDPSSVNRSGAQSISIASDISFRDLLSEASLFGKMRNASLKLESDSSLQPFFLGSSDVSIGGLLSEASLLSKKKSDTQSTEAGYGQIQSPWDDSLTTLSIGGLLSEASLQAKTGQIYAPSQKLEQSMHEPNVSILDAEETCHAFPIQKLQSSRDITTSNARVGSGVCSNDTNLKLPHFPRDSKTNNRTMFTKDSSCQGLEEIF